MRGALIMLAVATTAVGCAPAAQSSRSARPTSSSAEPDCPSCAKSFAARIVELHDARWRLVYMAISDARLRWRYGKIVARFKFARNDAAVELTLSFGAGGVRPVGFAERTVPMPQEVRSYSVEAVLVQAMRRSVPRALAPSTGGYALTIGAAEDYVKIDPDGYHVVLKSAAGASAAAMLVTMLRESARKRSLIAAQLDASGAKARFVFAGRDDRIVELDLDGVGHPTRAELRLARNTPSERVAPPSVEAAVRQWLKASLRVASVRQTSAGVMTLVNERGQTLTLDKTSFVHWERQDVENDDPAR